MVILAAITAGVAILLRYIVFLPVLYATGLDRRNSVSVSTKLAQVSEFCLVIAYLGTQLGHINRTHVSIVIFAFVIAALITPVLFGISDRLYQRLRPLLDLVGIRSRGVRPEAEASEPPRLVLLGVHRVASSLLADLERLHPDLLPRTLVVDINAATHTEIRNRGVQVIYGDIANEEVLRHAGVADAEVIISTIPDEILKGTNNEHLVRMVRQLAPKAVIVANCTRGSQVEALKAAGADHVFRIHAEAANGVLPAISAALNASLPSYLEALEEEHGPQAHRREVID